MSPLHQLYFDVVHKIILHRKEERVEVNYVDMNLIELLDFEVKIYLPRLILKHINRMLHQDEHGYSLAYGFWLRQIFEEYNIPILLWEFQTTKDVLGRVHYSSLPELMK